MAQEPPRQRRRRADHRGRRRRPQPQLRRRLGLRQRGLVDAVLRRRLPRHRPSVGARDAGAPGADRPAQVQVPDHVPLVRAAAPLSVRVAGPDAHRRTTRCSSRTRASTRPRRSTASTRASAPTSTSRTARPTTTRTRRPARCRGRSSWTRAATAAGSCSPTTRRSCRREFEKNLPFALDLAKSAPNPGQPVSHLGQHGQALLPRHGPGRQGPDGPDPEKTNNPLGRLHVPRLVRRPAAGAGAREARPERRRHRRRGVAEVPDHAERGRAGRADGADEPVERRRARPGRRLLLPRDAGRRDRDAARRLGEGVVHGRRPDERLVHVHGEGRVVEPRAGAGRGGLHGHLAGLQVEPAPGVPLVLPRRAGRERHRRRRLRRRREWPRGPEPARRALPLQGRRSGTRATTSSRATREWLPGTASRLANDELLAVRAVPRTRAAGCSTRASTPGCEYAQGYEFNPETNAPCDPNSAADGCQGLSDDFLQYYLGAYIYNEDAGTTAKGTLYDVVGRRTTRSTRLGWSFGAPSAEQPGPLRVVHHDERDPAEGAVPAVRQLGGGEVRAPRRAVRPAHRLALRVLATSRTSATSA